MQKKTKIIIISTILFLITISIIILLTKNANKQIPQQLTEQAKAQYETIIGNQSYDITNSVLEPNEITPAISAGMIPIKWNGTNFIITTKDDWCDYSNGQPAYIMLNDGYYKSEIEQGVTNEQLMENAVGNDALVVPNVPDNNPTIYMWIPRFAYNAQDEILYIKQSHSVAGTYTMPEIFTYQTEKRELSLAGIWVECNPLANTNAVNTKISNMQGPNNQYGFIANTIGTNANNETSYKTTIETYVNALSTNSAIVGASIARPQITDISNTNRTILKIINTNQLEPIKGKAHYDETEEKIKIEVTYRTNAITQILDSKGKILSENSTTADTGDEIIGNRTYKYIIIDNLGNIKEIKTTITGLDIYIIENEVDLKQFRDDVNAGKTTTNTKAYQIADVKINEGKYTVSEETGDITFESDAERWTPIGNSTKPYSGTYDGQGYAISGIYINTTVNNQGLFGNYSGNKLEGIKIKKSKIITNGQNVGGIVGCATSTKLEMIDCCNEGYIQGNKYASGLIGNIYSSSSSNSTSNFTISNCQNKGKVKGNSTLGGIFGVMNIARMANINILKCYNIGDIDASNSGTANRTGGIVGELGITATNSNNITCNILQCYNKGNVKSNGYAGGFVGLLSISSSGGNTANMNIESCYNIGKVTNVVRKLLWRDNRGSKCEYIKQREKSIFNYEKLL